MHSCGGRRGEGKGTGVLPGGRVRTLNNFNPRTLLVNMVGRCVHRHRNCHSADFWIQALCSCSVSFLNDLSNLLNRHQIHCLKFRTNLAINVIIISLHKTSEPTIKGHKIKTGTWETKILFWEEQNNWRWSKKIKYL